MKTAFLVSVPFTGLGLYNGFRGNRWLRNRITVFEKFVIPSLLNQTDRDFIVWVAWREEERNNPHVLVLKERLSEIPDFKFFFTYTGIPFWDDKYEDVVAHRRLATNLHNAGPDLMEAIGEAEEVHWLLQPSDDCYHKNTVEAVKAAFHIPGIQAVTYKKGYICDYPTGKLKEYNPETNPPFFAIKYPREVFLDPYKHMTYSGPFKSHEYIGDKLNLATLEGRGFLVGIHFDNISTVFDHPYSGEDVSSEVLSDFGIKEAGLLVIPPSIRRKFFKKLPYGVKRKLRYWSGEKRWILRPVFALIYNFLRD